MNAKEFFYELGKSIYRLDGAYANFAKNSNVPSTLMWILYALNDDKIHTQVEICNDWDLPKSTVNTIIKDLEHKGYVILTPIKGKRREMTVELTIKGKEYANAILESVYKVENTIFKSLGTDDYRVIDIINLITNLIGKKE